MSKRRGRGESKYGDPFSGVSRPGHPYYLSQQIIDGLSKEFVADCRQAFYVFDSKRRGSVSIDDVREIIRILGMEPNEDRLDSLIANLHKEGCTLEFPDFIQLIVKLEQDEGSEEMLRKAFQVFDADGSGSLPVDVIRHVLSELANGLTKEEADSIIKQTRPGDDNLVHYDYIIKKLCCKG